MLKIFTFLIFFISPLISWADVSFEYHNDFIIKMHISGKIGPADIDKINYAIPNIREKFPKAIFVAYLNSGGGDVDSALAIGRILRAKHMLAEVPENSICYSACVFVLAGAISRGVDGKVGIHRPYEVEASSKDASAQKAKYKILKNKVESYLEEVNVPVNLYSDMLYISPERIKVLNAEELTRYGLNVPDPYDEEASASTSAAAMGITRAEYARRKKLSNKKCNPLLPISGGLTREWAICIDKVMESGK